MQAEIVVPAKSSVAKLRDSIYHFAAAQVFDMVQLSKT
jgi:hypothetical protein